MSIQQCVDLINNAKDIAVLTGAGISTNAGIPDFRGPQGLYVTKQYNPETIFDINYFLQNPKPFYDFARDFITLEETIQPTDTHYFLANLEKAQKLSGIITQNIDSLHQKAGSKNVLEIHGSFWLSHCLNCNSTFEYEEMKTKIINEDIPLCPCGGVIKPDVVFFGENVKHIQEAEHLAQTADLFFVIGSSCVVYPAALIPEYTTGKVIVVNRDPVNLKMANVVLTVKDDIDSFFNQVSNQLSCIS